jgi:ABC-type dipeptide/oligopeptide/nickel transport system permease component
VAYAIINIVVDIAYGLLDPRIRLGAEAREA